MIEPEVMAQRIKELEKRLVDQAITICNLARILTETKRELEATQELKGRHGHE